MKKAKFGIYITISLVTLLLIFFGIGLGLNPREIPSPLVNKQAPNFEIPNLLNPTKTFSKKDLLGKVSLLNFWATWCPSCYTEHQVLIKIAETKKVTVFGIDWKDEPEKAKEWLKKLGNPYFITGSDESGYAGIDFGVYGAPETYLLDKNAKIILKHTGPIDWQIWQEKFLPIINKLKLQ